MFTTAPVLYAADLVFVPAQDTHQEGESFSVDVYVSNNTEAINAVSGSFSFPADILSVRSLSKDGSIVKLWAEEPVYSNANGTVKFEGVILNPGFSGSKGKVLTIFFTTKREGTAGLTFINGSVLANDGSATNVVDTMGKGSYVVVARAPVPDKPTTPATIAETPSASPSPDALFLTSSTHPEETAWYSSRSVAFAWKLPSTATVVRTLYDTKANSTPNKVYDPPIKSKSFTTDDDGIMYMHVQMKDANGWGSISHRRFQIDTEAPHDMVATVQGGNVSRSAMPTVVVVAQDDLSGLDHISFRVDGGNELNYPVSPSNTYKLPQLTPREHSLTISAYDKASNSVQTTLSVTIEELEPPVISQYTKRAEYSSKLSVSGTTYPDMTVEVSFADEGGAAKIETTKADSNGEFSLVWSDPQTGTHEMSARVVDENGISSAWTEGRLVVVENVKLIRIGMFIMNWLSLILIIILAAMLVVATFWYSFLQFARFRRKIHRTLKEAEDTLRVNVQALRRDTEEFHTVLVKAQKKRELTKEESAILKKFRKRLDVTEKEIEKKLEQIG
jgi:hypothetical protein